MMATAPPLVVQVLGPHDHVGDCTIAQNSHAGRIALFTHATTILLQLNPGNQLLLALVEGYSEFGDLIGLSVEDIDKDPNPFNVLPYPSPAWIHKST